MGIVAGKWLVASGEWQMTDVFLSIAIDRGRMQSNAVDNRQPIANDR